MALTNQEQTQIDDIDSRVSANSGSISKNQADIQGIDNQNFLKIIKRSFVHVGCEVDKSASDLSISISKGSDSKSIAIVDGKYLEVSDSTIFVPANTSGSTRIDLIYLTREGGLLIKSGVAGSGLAPSLPDNSLELYTISIPTGTTINLSACTLTDRRINVSSGHYLPTTGIALNESFLLTQQDGSNLAGLYYWDGSNWNILSSGGLVANYYTKESVDVLAAGMTEAEYRARQQENKGYNDGSGFTKFGSNYALGSRDEINKGMFTRISSIKDTYSKYLYLTSDCEVSTNGVNIRLKDIESIAGFDNSIALPDAPTDENARQDLVGLEYWEEETDNVHPKGCTQSSATLLNGIATVIPTFTGADTYSRFGTWQAAGALVGRVVKFSTATLLQKMAMLSDPENCLFFNELGNLTQGKNRARVIKGLTSSGAEWFEKLPINGNGLRYDATASGYVLAKGAKTSLASDIGVAGANEYYILDPVIPEDKSKIGHFTAYKSGIATDIAYKGNCFFMPIAMVSRNRNQKGYHPEYNPMGTKKFSDNKFWYDTTVSINSTADCLNDSNLLAASGYISSGVSGRPDGLYYDEINQSDIRDLRLPTTYKKKINNELADLIKANRRGYESEKRLIKASLTCDTVVWNAGNSNTYFIATGESVSNNSFSKGDLSRAIGFVKLNDGLYYIVSQVEASAGNTYINFSKEHGDISSKIDNATVYDIHYWYDTDRFQNNKNRRCEILGNPSATYYPTSHVGVANVFNVNTGSRQLPSDLGSGVQRVFLMASKAVTFSANTAIYVTNISGVPIPFTRGSSGTALQYDAVDNDNTIWINFDSSFGPLGYANVEAMEAQCTIFVFFEGYSNGFNPSINEEIENLEYSRSFETQRLQASYGAKVASDLLGKVLTNAGFTSTRYCEIIEAHIDSPTDKFYTASLNIIKTATIVGMGGSTGVPAIKYFIYQTNINGLLYNVLVFKEMKFNGDWGDDQKFDITDNIKTKTDDNAQLIVYGTVIDVNPVGFAKD